MLVFSKTDLAKRSMCSPLSPTKMNLQMFLGNATFAAIVWLLICALNLLSSGMRR